MNEWLETKVEEAYEILLMDGLRGSARALVGRVCACLVYHREELPMARSKIISFQWKQPLIEMFERNIKREKNCFDQFDEFNAVIKLPLQPMNFIHCIMFCDWNRWRAQRWNWARNNWLNELPIKYKVGDEMYEENENLNVYDRLTTVN